MLNISAYVNILNSYQLVQEKNLFGYETYMKKEVQVFKAFSDETRLRILLLLLNNGELCVCDLMESLQIPQSTTSRHLTQLRNAGLIDGERRGAWMYYRFVEDRTLASAILKNLKQHCSKLETAVADQKRCLKYLSTKDDAACIKTDTLQE